MDWNEYFEYRDGVLYWLNDRDRSQFLSARGYRSWLSKFSGRPAGRANTSGHLQTNIGGKKFLNSRIIFEMRYGPIPPNKLIDHINGIPGDNRVENMRLASKAENSRNRKRNKRHSVGYKGVSRVGELYQARIMKDRVPISLGYFVTPELAHDAYCDASEKLHGEFGRAS